MIRVKPRPPKPQQDLNGIDAHLRRHRGLLASGQLTTEQRLITKKVIDGLLHARLVAADKLTCQQMEFADE